MTDRAAGARPMRLAEFLRVLFEVVLDSGVVLFSILAAFLISIGLGMLNGRLLMVPGAIFTVFATSALLKYATVVSRALALGLPVPSAEAAIFDYFRETWAFLPWVALVVYNLLFFYIAVYTSGSIALALAVATLPLIPAAIGAVAVNRSLVPMLRIFGLVRIIRITGVDYLKVLMVWIAAGAVAWWLRSLASGFSLSFLAVLLGTLQVMLVFSATGIVFFHHHAALGIPIMRETKEVRAEQRAAEALERERRTALDQAYAFFSRGNSVGGLQRIAVYLDTHPDDPDPMRWFLAEMQGWESIEPALLFARNYVSLLLADEDQSRAATRLLLWCLRADPRFMPHESDRAAAAALLAGYPEEDLARRWPGVSA